MGCVSYFSLLARASLVTNNHKHIHHSLLVGCISNGLLIWIITKTFINQEKVQLGQCIFCFIVQETFHSLAMQLPFFSYGMCDDAFMGSHTCIPAPQNNIQNMQHALKQTQCLFVHGKRRLHDSTTMFIMYLELLDLNLVRSRHILSHHRNRHFAFQWLTNLVGRDLNFMTTMHFLFFSSDKIFLDLFLVVKRRKFSSSGGVPKLVSKNVWRL